jgi:hypothetical protein
LFATEEAWVTPECSTAGQSCIELGLEVVVGVLGLGFGSPGGSLLEFLVSDVVGFGGAVTSDPSVLDVPIGLVEVPVGEFDISHEISNPFFEVDEG